MKGRTRRSSGKRGAPKVSLAATRSPGKLLHDAHMRLSAGLVDVLREAGYPLPIDAWGVLNLLWEQDNLPQFEISKRIGRDRHQTSRLIDALSEQRLVARESVAEDRRIKHVVLTDTGRAAQPMLKGIATEYLERAFAGVNEEDYDSFIRCLQHLAAMHSPVEEEDVASSA